MKRFLLRTAFFLMPVIIGFALLYRLGFTPIMTSSMYLDHKLFWLQRHPIPDPKVMAVGSSQTIYSLDSRTFADSINIPYFNFGSWNMQIGDTKLLVQFLLDKYHPDCVILCASIPDFAGFDNPTLNNLTHSPKFALDKFPPLFYLTQFHSLHQIVNRHYRHEAQFVNFDPWGGGVGYQAPPPDANGAGPQWPRYASYLFALSDFQPQYRALDSLGSLLRTRGITFIFVQTPVMPSFIDTDSLRSQTARHFNHCKELVRNHGGIYLDFSDTTIFTNNLFNDPLHLNVPGAVLLTQKLVSHLKKTLPLTKMLHP